MTRRRHLGYKKMKMALIAIFVCSFFLILTYKNTAIFRPNTPIPIDLSILLDMPNLVLDDIFISVKTSNKFRDSRLPIILKTWFQLAKEHTWFFTDEENKELQNQTKGHMIKTDCLSSYNSNSLNCKMEMEYRYYMKSNRKWFCHFDDDDYINVPRLVEVLDEYDYKKDWYLGKRSTFSPVKLVYRSSNNSKWALKDAVFWFGTGGAGFCLSRPLAKKMYSVVIDNGFMKLCNNLTLQDDVCVGFLVHYVTGHNVTLTQIPGFHSHIEIMSKLSVKKFRKQITFSYSKRNTIVIPGFNTSVDPTRFLSLHCFLFPDFDYCESKEGLGIFDEQLALVQ